MKKQYIESAVLTLAYIIGSGITLYYFDSNSTFFRLITYPAKICLDPIIHNEFSIKTINIGLFVVYFLWAFNCVYLNIIKSTLKQFNSNFIKKF